MPELLPADSITYHFVVPLVPYARVNFRRVIRCGSLLFLDQIQGILIEGLVDVKAGLASETVEWRPEFLDDAELFRSNNDADR